MTGGGGATVHLGIAAYVWGAPHQDHLLVGCLAPTIRELRRQGLARRFWLDRNDARGPHVFAVVTVPREAAPEIAKQLTDRLGSHLAAHPSPVVLSPDQLARRHAATRGKRQCEADGRTGWASNNSFEIFEHPSFGYPFWLSEGLTGEEELWDLLADLTLWAIGRLAVPGVRSLAAARYWTACVERELRLSGAPAAEYWLHHATSLVPDLVDGMEREEKAAVLTELADGMDAANPASPAWQEAVTAVPVWPGLPDLLRLILDGGLPSPWPLLREVNHAVLKQIGVPVALHLPLALYAWIRSTQEAPGAESAVIQP